MPDETNKTDKPASPCTGTLPGSGALPDPGPLKGLSYSTSPYNLLVVLGPTAAGKTAFAARLARTLDAEIISADSRQVYRRLDLGTGKDYDDYLVDGHRIPAHLIDIREPGYKYNVYEFQHDFFAAFEQIQQRGKWPIICGGTGLYLEAVLKRYKMLPVPRNDKLRTELQSKSLAELAGLLAAYRPLHNTTDTDTVERALRALEIETYYREHPDEAETLPPVRPLIIGLEISREERRARITRRLEERLKAGLIREVEGLLEEGLSPADLTYYGLEYRYVTAYVTGELSYKEMFARLEKAIHQFAKRQMTWFRGMERRGATIYWLPVSTPPEQRIATVIKLLGQSVPGK